ncbi:MAG: Dabb family protein [Erysipelotrichaceae bacterium]|nr:Dabb family protein [Erysipelotrichaceae bacterium]
MKHYIILKFKKDVDYHQLLPDISSTLEELKAIKGIRNVSIYTNCIFRDNRYDLMIEIEMDKDALPIYDASLTHQKLKQIYNPYLENKTIFDHE